MRITAKFAGKCAHCGNPIKAGEQVEYVPDCKAVWHIDCYADRMETNAAPVKPVQHGVTARYRSPRQEMEYQATKAEAENSKGALAIALARIANHQCCCTEDDGCPCLDIVQEIAREALR